MKIGARIKHEKVKEKMRRKELAKQSAVHRLTIKKMEDQNDGKLSYFKKIFKALGYNKMKIVLWKETPGGTKSKIVEIKV